MLLQDFSQILVEIQERSTSHLSNPSSQFVGEIKEIWTPSDEEHILEPEIEKFLSCLAPFRI